MESNKTSVLQESETEKMHEWVTEGFAAFRRGTFANGGQNIYVSKAGILQRIYQYDLNHNGYFDLIFANCQNHHEAAPAYVYYRDGSMSSLPAQGAVSGAVADLYNSGNYDLIICGHYDMAQPFASSDIYFGSKEAYYSENRHIRVPSPWAESVCAGHFNGDKRPALAFSLEPYGKIRIFYPGELGIEWGKFVDLPLKTGQLCSADLDNDGFDELIVLENDSTKTTIYWGGPEGISAENYTVLPSLSKEDKIILEQSDAKQSQLEKELRSPRLPKVVKINKQQYLSVITAKRVIFYSFAGRTPQEAFSLMVPDAQAVCTGSLQNNGETDIFIAARHRKDSSEQQYSYLYYGENGNYHEEKRLALKTCQASDAVMADLEGTGFDSLIIAQSHTEYSYTNHTLIYKGGTQGITENPAMLEGEDTQRVFAVPQADGTKAILLVNHYARSAVGYDKTYIYWGSEKGYSPERMQAVPSWCAVDSLCADLNDDGWAELVVCNNSENSLHLDPGFHVHHFGPEGFIPEKSYLLQTNLGWGAVCADFNRNGYLDIIAVANQWRDLKIFYGSAEGFVESELIPLENHGSARWILAVDLNKNGWLDIIVPIINGDKTLILHGGEEGYSMKRHSKLAVFHGVCARTADLTGNGYPDLIIGTHVETPTNGKLTPQNPHHSYIHIYWNGPDGLSENNKSILKADAAVAMAIADFNNDGWLDIFVCNYHNGKERDINSIIYWNRQGQFKELDRDLLHTHSGSGCLAVDFNEDGYVDLAVANHKVDGDHQGFSTVWWNSKNGFNRMNSTDLPTAGPHGMTAIEPGNQLDRSDEEFYISEVYLLKNNYVVNNISFEAEIPDKTWIKSWIRFSCCKEKLVSASWEKLNQQKLSAGTFIQYKLALGAKNSLRTPRIKKVTVSFYKSVEKA